MEAIRFFKFSRLYIILHLVMTLLFFYCTCVRLQQYIKKTMKRKHLWTKMETIMLNHKICEGNNEVISRKIGYNFSTSVCHISFQFSFLRTCGYLQAFIVKILTAYTSKTNMNSLLPCKSQRSLSQDPNFLSTKQRPHDILHLASICWWVHLNKNALALSADFSWELVAMHKHTSRRCSRLVYSSH